MIVKSAFSPKSWLRNRHVQTLLGPLTVPVTHHPENWQTIELPDDDFMEIAWFGSQNKPLIFILHGLEGSYRSHYIQRIIRHAIPQGWQLAVMHFRSCGRSINRRTNSYHSGASEELQYAIESIQGNLEQCEKVALGFSLGGNVLLKWLGENPKQSFFRSAMAVSVPLKLDECASAIDSGFSKLYQKHLIRSLVKKTACKLNGNFPGPLLEASTLAEDLSNFWQFDEKVTAPLHGFRSAKDYYELSSSYHFLPRIETPTLVLQAIDDPFLNADMIPDKSHLGSGVTVEVSEKGGHVGFMESINDRTQSCFLAKKVMHYFGAD